MSHPTLLRPRPQDAALSPIENAMEVIEVAVLGPDIYTNARPIWHPPGARGIYGGAVASMSLAAGQRTVAPEFAPHSFHSYFLLAGNAEVPIVFHVERVRDGRSFATRTVQARQRGKCIFTATMSFVKQVPGAKAQGQAKVQHAVAIPASRPPVPSDDYDDEHSLDNQYQRALLKAVSGGGEEPKEPKKPKELPSKGDETDKKIKEIDGEDLMSAWHPVMAGPMRLVGGPGAPAHLKKTQQWVRMRGKIAGGRAAHLNALAYLSDRYFIGTVCRIHALWRLPFSIEGVLADPASEADSRESDDSSEEREFWQNKPQLRQLTRAYIESEAEAKSSGLSLEDYRHRPSIAMMVSLDHSVYFHAPEDVRADEWMLVEMDSPWADDNRGVVTQRIFNKEGTLLASCFQEGVVRLKDQKYPKAKL